MNKVSIIIPALNERPNLEQLIPRIASTCSAADIVWEILVVDSDSNDGTDSLLNALAKKFPLRQLNEPIRGDLARAWRKGIESAHYPFIITMDADLCHTPEFIPELVTTMNSSDMVIASRYLHHDGREWTKPLLNELVSRLGQRFCSRTLRLPFTDISHGFRAFRKELYESIKDDIKISGNTFMIALLYYAHKSGARIREIPYMYGKRLYGKDHLKISRESMRFFAFILSAWRKP
ncbi:MAG TPA: glycosyltransferase [Smithellaceae bacterium]|nr:glycosyltransferase [Smithellaceae bacterium]